MDADIVIIGAGVAGLICARRLVDAGRTVVLLEKSRGVGGRCATRRIGDVPVDHGLAFYHGRDQKFREYLESTGGEGGVLDWPGRIRGDGTPCQPGAFREGDWRLAHTDGVNVFPEHLARGLDIRCNSRVAAIESAAGLWRAADQEGREVTAGDLVLTNPAPQVLDLLDSLKDVPCELGSIRSLLGEIGYVSTLTVIALYPDLAVVPEWDMWYPEDSPILQLLSHDSGKRRRPDVTALVLQALPAWSRRHLEVPEDEWAASMLVEAGRLAGSWAARPATVQAHRWRFARIGSGGDLSGPMLTTMPAGGRLGLAGEGFSPGGGVQAAWRSGCELARRLLEEQER